MTARAAEIPDRYTPRQLCQVMAAIRRDPDLIVRTRSGRQFNGAQYRSWFLKCLHQKINRGQEPRGRKDCRDWYSWAWRTSRAVNTPRLIVRPSTVPLEFRERLAHRLTDPGDEY